MFLSSGAEMSVHERLKMKRAKVDSWSIKEKLCLASSVLRSGDQNWGSVSRSLRSFGEPARPPDWFSQKHCAVQYSNLLEHIETPKRKKRSEKADTHVETPGESIVRKLTQERVEELKKLLQDRRLEYLKLKEEAMQVKAGFADERLTDLLQEIEEKKKKQELEAESHLQWLKEREEKKLELERAWKPPVASASPHGRKIHRNVLRRNSSQSEPSSEAESALDSPLSEPLNIDVIGEEQAETQTEPKLPPPTPTSPLLTSLLKSPSPAPTSQASSILHSAITSHRGSTPTITSLLNSAPGIPGTSGAGSVAPPTSVSSSLKNLVSSAISGAGTEHHPTHATSPAAGAPTLSMLLELPPSLPGKPLPELPSVTIPPSTSTSTSVPTVGPGEVCHPEHQEMRVRRELGTDEPVEVVELETPRSTSDNQELAVTRVEPVEVLIEEVVVNESDMLPVDILRPSSNIEQQDDKPKDVEKDIKENEDTKDKIECDKTETSELRVETNNDDSQTSKSSPKDAAQTPIIKDKPKEESTKEMEVVIEGSSCEVTEMEPGLSSGTVAEVIEIANEVNDGNVLTEVVGPGEELADMEVIILDKVGEQVLEDVHIVDAMKDLECQVVEVVMGSQEKSEEQEHKSSVANFEKDNDDVETADSTSNKTLAVENIVSDLLQPQVENKKAEPVSNVVGSEVVCNEMAVTGDSISDNVKIEESIKEESTKTDSPKKEVSTTDQKKTSDDVHEEKTVPLASTTENDMTSKEKVAKGDSKEDLLSKNSNRKDKVPKDDAKKSIHSHVLEEVSASSSSETKKTPKETTKNEMLKDVIVKDNSKKNTSSIESSKKGLVLKEKEHANESNKSSDKELSKKDASRNEGNKKDAISKESTKKDSHPKEASKKDISSKEITKMDSVSKDIPKKDTSLKDSTKKDALSKDSSKKDTASKDSIHKKETTSKKGLSSKESSKKGIASRESTSNDSSSKDTGSKKDTSKDGSKDTHSKDSSFKKETSSKDNSPKKETSTKDKKDTLQRDSKRDLSSKEGSTKRDTHSKDNHKKDVSSSKESTRKDIISKEGSKKDILKEDTTKDVVLKELTKKEGSIKEESKSHVRDGSRKDISIKDSIKKDLSKKQNNKDAVKESSRKEVTKKDSVVKDSSKDKESSTKENHRKEKATHVSDDSRKSSHSREASKKDNSKDISVKEGMKESVKRDTGKKERRKENPKRSSSKEDRRDSHTRDDSRKKSSRECAKKDIHKKVDSEPKMTESSTVDEHLLKSCQSEGSVEVAKDLLAEEVKVEMKTGSGDGDGCRSKDTDNKDLVSKVQPNGLVMEESHNDKEVNSVALVKDIPVDEVNKPALEIEKSEGDKSSILLEDTKYPEADDATEGKLDKLSLIRAETPSTEDDKTNDAETLRGVGKKRLGAGASFDSIPNSPASVTDDEREYRSWKKSIMLLYGRLATHKYASLFLKPITDDQAPGYSSIVHRPIDLLTIKKNIEMGVTRTNIEFQRDVMLMFQNAIMYNKSSYFVHNMARHMYLESMQHIQDYLNTQLLVQVQGEAPLRRETRTTEANKQRDVLGTPGSASQDESEGPSTIKRKRTQVSESEKSAKKKKSED